MLVREFLKEFCRGNIREVKLVDQKAIDLLMQYDWPGNVRELSNLTERLVILSKEKYIKEEDLPISFRRGTAPQKGRTVQEVHADPPWLTCNDFREAKTIFERQYLTRKLAEHNGNIKMTAEAIGLERRHLHRKISALGLDV